MSFPGQFATNIVEMGTAVLVDLVLRQTIRMVARRGSNAGRRPHAKSSVRMAERYLIVGLGTGSPIDVAGVLLLYGYGSL